MKIAGQRDSPRVSAVRSHLRKAALYYVVAKLTFATAADFNSALASAEMTAAGADTDSFADGGITLCSTEETVYA